MVCLYSDSMLHSILRALSQNITLLTRPLMGLSELLYSQYQPSLYPVCMLHNIYSETKKTVNTRTIISQMFIVL